MPGVWQPRIVIAVLKEKGVKKADLERLPRRLKLPKGTTRSLNIEGIIQKAGTERINGSLTYIWGPGCRYSTFMEQWK